MTDLVLKAGVDFTDAKNQVDAFVRASKQSFSQIMAAANKPGGSMAGPGGAVAAQAAQIAKAQKTAAEQATNAAEATYRRATFVQEQFQNRQLASAARFQSKMRAVMRDGAMGSLGDGAGNIGLQRALEQDTAKTVAALQRKQDAIRRFNANFLRDQEKAAADEMAGLQRKQNAIRTFNANFLRQQEADAAKQEAVAQRAAKTAMAGSRAVRFGGENVADTLARGTQGGTGRQAALSDFYTRQAEAAEKAAERVQKANERIARVSAQADTRAVGAAENSALGVSNRIARQLSADAQLQSQLYARLDSALKTYTSTIQTYGARSLEATRATVAWNRELQTIRGVIAEKGGLLRTLNQNTESVVGSIGRLGTGFGSLNRLLLNTQVVLTGLTAAFGLREVLDAIQQYERFSNTIRTVSGSAGEAQRNLSFLFGEADRIGFSVTDVGNAFARLSVAMTNIGFSGNETRQTFTQLAEASRNFGLSSADTNGVIRALEQSMSKGKFMAEEVRLQMGDRLPIAMAALKRAVEQVDGRVVDINKRFEEGSLDVGRYATAFVRAINEMSGGSDALTRTSQGLSAAFGRVSTEFTRFSVALGEGGLTNATITVTENLRNLMATVRESGGLEVLGGFLEQAAQSMNILAAAAVGLAALLAGRMVQGVVAFLAAATPLVRLLSAIAAGATVAIDMLDRIGGRQRNYTELTSSVRNANQEIEKIRGTINEFNDVLSRNVTSLDSSSTALDRRIAALQRMGQTEAEATAAVAREEAERLRIREAAAARELSAAEASRNNLARNLSRNMRALPTTVQNIETELANPRLGSAQRGALTESLEMFRRALPAVEAFMAGTIKAQEAVQQLNSAFRNSPIPPEIERIRRALADASVDQRFVDAENAVETARKQLEQLRADLERFANQFSDPIRVQINMDLIRRELNDAPGQGREIRGPRSLTASEDDIRDKVVRDPTPARTAENVRGWLRESGLGRNLDGGQRFGFDPSAVNNNELVRRLRQNQDFRRLAPNLAGALDGVNLPREGGPRGPAAARSDAVREFMQDLERQSGSAGREGAAEAFAQALNRLQDAAQNARASVATLAEEQEVYRLVQERLNKELDLHIKQTERQTQFTNEVARAYLQGTEAGQAMEVSTRAQADAFKYAEANSISYEEAVKRLTKAYGANEQAARNAAAGRQAARDRDDAELAALEGQLVGLNSRTRNRELAAARARINNRGASPEFIQGAEDAARALVNAREKTEQLNNSWNELSRVGEQAFDRIGEAITQSLARGEMSFKSFGNIAKAVLSEIVQAVLRLAVINPVLNALFGGTRGTAGGVFSVLSGAGTVARAASNSGVGEATSAALGQMGGAMGPATAAQVSAAASGTASGGGLMSTLSSLGSVSSIARMGQGLISGAGLGAFFPGGAALAGGTLGGAMGFLNTPLIASGTNAALAGMGGALGPATAAQVAAAGGGAGLTLVQALGPAAAIGGGVYGAVSGFQRGGVGGALQGIGGITSAVAGGAMLGGALGIGALAPLAALGPAGLIAGAAMAIIGSLLPGQRPSEQGGETRINFATQSQRQAFLTGRRFSQANLDASAGFAGQVNNLVQAVAAQTGIMLDGDVGIGVTRSRLYGEVGAQQAIFSRNDEAGLQNWVRQAALAEFKRLSDRAPDQRVGEIVRRANSFEEMDEGIRFLRNVYDVFAEGVRAPNEYAKAIADINEQFASSISMAERWGLDAGRFIRTRDQAIAEATAERNRSVEMMRVGFDEAIARGRGDAGLAASAAQRRERIERERAEIETRRNLEKLGASAEETADIMGRFALAADLSARAASGMAQAALQSASSIQEWLLSQRLGDLSSLNPVERLGVAEQAFVASLGTGDSARITQSATDFLSLGREVFAATEAYAQQELQVRALVGQAGLNVARASGDESTIGAFQQIVAALQGEISNMNARLAELSNETRRANDRAAAGG